MEFGIAKLPKTFYKNTEKNFKREKSYNKELRSFKDRKVNTNLCYSGRISFVTWQVNAIAAGVQGGLTLHLGLLK